MTRGGSQGEDPTGRCRLSQRPCRPKALRARPGGDVAAGRPGCEFVSCFLPCTPNPTTGFFFYAPRDKVIELDITVEQAMTLIMSAGMAQPNGDAQKKLATLVENGRANRIAEAERVLPP